METPALAALLVLLMIPCLFLIPLGLPGTWIMLGLLGLAVWSGEVAWWLWLVLILVAGAAEVAEFFIVRHTNRAYGGSRRAFWGAIVGGALGVFLGVPFPVPVVGSLVGGLVGTFAGAALVTYRETRRVRSAGRVAWGTLIGRGFAAAAKTAAGVVVLVVGAASLVLR